MVDIRAMAAEDIGAILKLASETPEAPHWDRSAYEQIPSPDKEMRASRAAWVATNGRDLLGFTVVHLVAEVCELESIVVAKPAQRKGVGKSLLNAVTEWSLASGAQKLELEVRADNEPAIAFYESAGLIREGLRIGYYRDPQDDAVLMGKRL
ncbi:MAG: GNAT family N-acetyltransferase [Silvibacterium sp.]|nr:GNAT family N-acetyltransferase [Silvibacterium sp.]